ncbi:ATP-dependent nuclease [Longibacter salinarum]|uniref:ATP-dependent nuclease n=1 Tax=Longibacter salinarum TaxID=1850348 RepID=A0A2A8CZW6_9BACT|nr:PD-(D/E)XK nuclease family protein [Longibacter salinarum]PEN14269.1 ATP-dependent nuclease [Longibacter salinarum]
MYPSSVLDQLVSARRSYPEAPLIVLVPTLQVGYSLETDLARRLGSWHGIESLPPANLAEKVAMIDALTSGRRQMLSVGRLFYAADILRDMAPALRDTSAPGAHHLARTVSDAIQTLRLDAVDPDRLRTYAAEKGRDGTLGIIADAYDAYLDRLESNGLYDDAQLLTWAERRVRSGSAPGIEDSVVVLLNGVDLPERSYRFVRAVQDTATGFLRAGVSTPQRAPRESACARFSDVSEIQVESDGASDDRAFVRCVGALSEADAVIRDILESGVAFDDVTIAYTSSTPYATLLPDRAARASLPFVSGAGQPAMMTRTGRALHYLYEWVRDDFSAVPLITMLRENLLRMEDQDGDTAAPGLLTPQRAATLIAERSYEAGRSGLLKGLGKAVDQARNDADEKRTDAARSKLKERTKLFEHVLFLVDLLQPGTRRPDADVSDGALTCIDPSKLNEPVTLEQVARGTRRYLRSFGPPDGSDKPEEERTLDEVARRRLYEELEDLQHADISLRTDAGRIARLLQKWLTAQNVQPQQVRPGHVQILPLDAVGYSDRTHLYVVGMDSASFDAPVGENSLLGEEDRHVLQELDAATRDSSLTAADKLLWRTDQALARHRGPIMFYSRTFDVGAGEECDPSAYFLARERQAGDIATARTVPLIPQSGDIPLSDRDAWLAAYARRHEQDEKTSARDRLAERHPSILDGAAARAARASETYTEHDGLLPEGEYSDLDLFASTTGPVSASRLQTLAEAPYIYFLKYVLGVEPLNEPAIDDEAWLNSLRKGTLLHSIYERFVRELDGRIPEMSDEEALLRIVEEVLQEETERFEPSSDLVRSAALRELKTHARVFFRAEMDRDNDAIPHEFEIGFGLDDQDNNAFEAADLSVAGATLQVHGKIDRVDRHDGTGALSIWDYKTGRAKSYDESDPLQDGKTLQWALYAFALEALTGETVERAGYYFANATEVGARIGFPPAPHRSEAEKIIETLRDLTRTGTFPVTPRLDGVTDWKWNGYDRLVQDLGARKKEVRAKNKNYPDDRPKPPSF